MNFCISYFALEIWLIWLKDKCYETLTHFLTIEVSWTASYEITLLRLSAHHSPSCLKIGSLVFSDIVHDDNWQWYLVTDENRFLKKNLTAQTRVKWAKISLKIRFFGIFSSLVCCFSGDCIGKTDRKKLRAPNWVWN